MDDVGEGRESENNSHIDRLDAARMLREAESVSLQAKGGVDTRTQTLIKRWTPAVLFVYAATFLLLFTDEGNGTAANPASAASYANILLIPLLAGLMLVQGLRNKLPIAEVKPLQGRKLLFLLLGILTFMAVPAANMLGVGFSWWVCIIDAAVLAVISALATDAWTKNSPAGPLGRTMTLPRKKLGTRARWTTAGLGVYFRLTGAILVFPWFPIAAFVLTICLLALVFFANARWGLTSLGSQWMKRHWLAGGTSAGLLFVLALILVKASWHAPLAGILGGLVVAAPLVAVALKPGGQR